MKKKLLLLSVPLSFSLLWIMRENITNAKFLEARRIECKTQYGPCEEEDLKITNSALGENIITFNAKRLKEKLLQRFKNEEVFIQRVFPSTIEVVIQKRKGYIALKKEGIGEGFFVVDSDGTVLSFIRNTALPSFVLSTDYKTPVVGEKVDSRVVTSGKLVKLTSKIDEVRKATLFRDRLEIVLPALIVTYPVDLDPTLLTGALQLILTRTKMDNKVPVSVDLRYKNPVLTY